MSEQDKNAISQDTEEKNVKTKNLFPTEIPTLRTNSCNSNEYYHGGCAYGNHGNGFDSYGYDTYDSYRDGVDSYDNDG